MRPWEAEGFEWDEANESELAQPHHPIRPWEVEEVFGTDQFGLPTEGAEAVTA